MTVAMPSAMQEAAKRGDLTTILTLLRSVRDRAEAVCETDAGGSTSLHFAIHADPEKLDVIQAVMSATCTDEAAYRLAAARDALGSTALHYAAELKRPGTLNVILSNIPRSWAARLLGMKDRRGMHVWDVAQSTGDHETMQACLDFLTEREIRSMVCLSTSTEAA